MFTPELFAQSLIAGVIIGVIYALMALGITFIYSIVKMINWAMGEFYMIGSFVQYFLVVGLVGPDLWYIAAILSALSVFLVGFLGGADPDQADVHGRHRAQGRLRDGRYDRAPPPPAESRD